MAHIDYFMITLSPFCYLAGDELEQIAEKHGATIAYKPVNLLQIFAATGGIVPADRHPARQAYRMQELTRVAKAKGLPINLKPAFFPSNPVPSCYSVINAQNSGGWRCCWVVPIFSSCLLGGRKGRSGGYSFACLSYRKRF